MHALRVRAARTAGGGRVNELPKPPTDTLVRCTWCNRILTAREMRAGECEHERHCEIRQRKGTQR